VVSVTDPSGRIYDSVIFLEEMSKTINISVMIDGFRAEI
jgi:hypothetical protein